MEYRNALWTLDERIDCEIKHPIYGWIPFTADPDDTGAQFNVAEMFAEMVKSGNVSATATLDPAIALAQARAAMVISPLQGILTLGETEWGKVLAYRDGFDKDGKPFSSWGEKVIINSAQDWRRDSQNIDFFGYLLGYSPEEMDALFIAAAQVKA